MTEYTGWDNYVKQQEEKDPLEKRLYNIEKLFELYNRIYFLEDSIKDIKERLDYNQIVLPNGKRFTPAPTDEL